MNIKNFLILTLAIASLLDFSSCRCDDYDQLPSHTFETKYTISPEHLEYKVGDTIWLSSFINCRGLTNTLTNATEDYCGLKGLTFYWSIYALEPMSQETPAATPATASFYFVSDKGDVAKLENKGISAYYQSDGDEYQLKIGFVPRKAGKFFSKTISGISYRLPDAGKCDFAAFSFSPDVQDNHLDLFTDFIGGVDKLAQYDTTSLYCFIVK